MPNALQPGASVQGPCSCPLERGGGSPDGVAQSCSCPYPAKRTMASEHLLQKKPKVSLTLSRGCAPCVARGDGRRVLKEAAGTAVVQQDLGQGNGKAQPTRSLVPRGKEAE